MSQHNRDEIDTQLLMQLSSSQVYNFMVNWRLESDHLERLIEELGRILL